MSDKTSVLLSPPTHFDVRYAINPWMMSQIVDPGVARKQFDRLVQCYIDLGLTIHQVDQRADLPDMVFTANAGLMIGSAFIPANFRYAERAPESALFENYFAGLGRQIINLKETYIFEGAGDALYCGDQLFLGFGFRSGANVREGLSAYIDPNRIVSLGLANPYFYHLDTCFSPLPSGKFVYYPDAFDDQSRKLLERRGGYWVTEKFCMRYGCNMVAVGDTIVTSFVDDRLQEIAKHEGLKVIRVEVNEFLKAGGGVRCLSFLF